MKELRVTQKKSRLPKLTGLISAPALHPARDGPSHATPARVRALQIARAGGRRTAGPRAVEVEGEELAALEVLAERLAGPGVADALDDGEVIAGVVHVEVETLVGGPLSGEVRSLSTG